MKLIGKPALGKMIQQEIKPYIKFLSPSILNKINNALAHIMLIKQHRITQYVNLQIDEDKNWYINKLLVHNQNEKEYNDWFVRHFLTSFSATNVYKV